MESRYLSLMEYYSLSQSSVIAFKQNTDKRPNSMEAVARGVIEQAIDDELTDKRLELNLNTFKRFEEEGYVKSAESAMFGKIYAEAFNYFVNYKMYNKDPISLEEMEEFERVIDRRILEIWSKIMHLSAK